MHIETKQEVCRSSPHESTYGLLYFIKHNNDMHAPATLQKL